MLAKVSILVLSILLVSFVLLSGCVGVTSNDNLGENKSNLNSDDQQANDDQASQDAKDAAQAQINDTFSDPNATPQEILDALAQAQRLGLDTPELDAKTKAFLKKWIDDIIKNPNSTPEMLLNALAVAQLFVGDEDEAYYNQVMSILKQKINSELTSQSLCKARLMEIAKYAQLLGFDEIASTTLARAEGMPEECGNTTVEYSEIYNGESSSKTINATFRGTSMKLFAPGGFTMPDNKMYSLVNGSVNYNYFDFYDDGCIEYYRKGNGTQKLEGYLESMMKNPMTDDIALGVLGRTNDDKYSGNFSVTFEVTVREAKKQFIPKQPGEEDPCKDVKAKPPYTERGTISANFDGTSDDSKIADTKREVYEGGDTIIIWNLTLED